MLKGYVSGAFFLGDRTRLIIGGVGQEKLTIEIDSRREYAKGDEIAIAIAADAVLTF